MNSLVSLIENTATGLYIICIGGILYMLYSYSKARRELAVSQFKLEREHALVRRAKSITMGGLLIELLISIWAITNLMAPTLRDIEIQGNPGGQSRPDRFVTSTPGARIPLSFDASGGLSSGDDLAIFATPEPTQTPVGTIEPGAAVPVGCARDRAWLLIPGNGQRIFESTTVQGTASINNFAFYRFEIKPDILNTSFAPIGGDYTQPVVDGPLGELIPLNFAEGSYRFRLTVFDNTNVMQALCEVTIHISEPPPTATPIGAAAPSGE